MKTTKNKINAAYGIATSVGIAKNIIKLSPIDLEYGIIKSRFNFNTGTIETDYFIKKKEISEKK